jgi:hypothetical protein
MMTDYKFTDTGLAFIIKGTEYHYPLALLPKFGGYVEVRKNEKDELEEIETNAIINTLLIEEVASSNYRTRILHHLFNVMV